MKKVLLALLVVGLGAGAYLYRSHESAPESEEKVIAAPVEIPVVEAPKTKVAEPLQSSGLPDDKLRAISELESFHSSTPALNEENQQRRQRMLDVLNASPGETVEGLRHFFKTATPREEEQRAFLMNITMALDLSDEEKASVFLARSQKGAKFREDGAVEDDELSLVMAFTNLSRLEDQEAKREALDELRRSPLMESAHFRQLFNDHFPSTNQSP